MRTTTRIIKVGIGEGAVCNEPGVMLKTYGLGSCVGLALTDTKSGVSGLAHIALPSSSEHAGAALLTPYRFADTAVPTLVAAMRGLGAVSRPSLWTVLVAGGVSTLSSSGYFRIGDRNRQATREALMEAGFFAPPELFEGLSPGTVALTTGATQWLG